MRTGLIAKKLAMTNVYTDAGVEMPVTVLVIENCQVVSRKPKKSTATPPYRLALAQLK